MFINKKLSIAFGINARRHNGMNPTWLGFSYGSWLPHFYSNAGAPGEVQDFNCRWLCFHASITRWP